MIIFQKKDVLSESVRNRRLEEFLHFPSDDLSFGILAEDRLDPLCSEEEAYEYFCEIADTFIGYPITAEVKFGNDSAEGESLLRSRIRAVYRASVWGQFSLLCSGISTPGEMHAYADILKDSFCELESEGREFNGFITKGVLVNTPMLLYRLPGLKYDFVCFDFERLLRLSTGFKNCRVGRTELAAHIIKLCEENGRKEAALIARSKEHAEDMLKSLDGLKINRLYFL